MKSHKNKMVAPIVITAIIVIYYILYFSLIFATVDGAIKYVLGVLPLLLGGMMIYVCIERIKEIKKGEEDDISKY